jgi:hypothetical protein
VTALLVEAFGAGAGVLATPWTQAALSGTTLNTDGAGHGKASAADASFDCMAYDGVHVYQNDQYGQVQIAGGLTSGVSYAIVLVRCSGSGGSFQGYEFITDGSAAGAGHTELYKYLAGVGSVKANFLTGFTTNDVMKIDVVGNLFTVYKNGVSIGTFTDSVSPIASGAPGCGVFNTTNNALLDNFEGGDFLNVAPRIARAIAPQQRMLA